MDAQGEEILPGRGEAGAGRGAGRGRGGAWEGREGRGEGGERAGRGTVRWGGAWRGGAWGRGTPGPPLNIQHAHPGNTLTHAASAGPKAREGEEEAAPELQAAQTDRNPSLLSGSQTLVLQFCSEEAVFRWRPMSWSFTDYT